MANDFPSVGQVFDYHYLWKWQANRGETEGRKKRPSCVAVLAALSDGQRMIFIAPITSKAPDQQGDALPIPAIEARRAGLETNIDLWLIVTELNVEFPDRSYSIEDRHPRGSFSPAFMRKVAVGLTKMRERRQLSISNRG